MSTRSLEQLDRGLARLAEAVDPVIAAITVTYAGGYLLKHLIGKVDRATVAGYDAALMGEPKPKASFLQRLFRVSASAIDSGYATGSKHAKALSETDPEVLRRMRKDIEHERNWARAQKGKQPDDFIKDGAVNPKYLPPQTKKGEEQTYMRMKVGLARYAVRNGKTPEEMFPNVAEFWEHNVGSRWTNMAKRMEAANAKPSDGYHKAFTRSATSSETGKTGTPSKTPAAVKAAPDKRKDETEGCPPGHKMTFGKCRKLVDPTAKRKYS